MTRLARAFTALAALLMIGAFALPLWQIRLLAPQYPEGLGLLIHVNTVRGMEENDLGKINGLNHYIGMKAIDPEAIPVLHVMPWVLGALVVGGLIVALAGRRKLLAAWLGAYAAAATLGLLEFWKWERDYGRNLDLENAIIKVPGMTYEPPLIGAKQLLNFTAISLPAAGTVLLGVAFLLGTYALFLSIRAARAARVDGELATPAAAEGPKAAVSTGRLQMAGNC
jgi:copper chaperone NosL